MGNTVEAVGAENCTWDWEKESVNIKKRQRELQILDEDIDLYKYEGSKDLNTFIKTADLMLAGPFNFYNFSVRLNIEEQQKIARNEYNNLYKQKVHELIEENKNLKQEAKKAAKMVDGFESIIANQEK